MEATRELWTSADALNHDRIDYNQNGSGELNIGTMLIANLIVKKKKNSVHSFRGYFNFNYDIFFKLSCLWRLL